MHLPSLAWPQWLQNVQSLAPWCISGESFCALPKAQCMFAILALGILPNSRSNSIISRHPILLSTLHILHTSDTCRMLLAWHYELNVSFLVPKPAFKTETKNIAEPKRFRGWVIIRTWCTNYLQGTVAMAAPTHCPDKNTLQSHNPA